MYHNIAKQQAASLMAAIFILVVLASISSYVVSISNISRTTTSLALEGVRAYFAARSGLEWGINQVVATPTSCPADTTISFTEGGISGFNALVTCSFSSVTEGTGTYNIFNISSTATKGTFGTTEYVSRQMQVLVTLQ